MRFHISLLAVSVLALAACAAPEEEDSASGSGAMEAFADGRSGLKPGSYAGDGATLTIETSEDSSMPGVLEAALVYGIDNPQKLKDGAGFVKTEEVISGYIDIGVTGRVSVKDGPCQLMLEVHGDQVSVSADDRCSGEFPPQGHSSRGWKLTLQRETSKVRDGGK